MITIQDAIKSQKPEARGKLGRGFLIFTMGLLLFFAQNAFAATKWDFTIPMGPPNPLALLMQEFVDEVKAQTHGNLEIILRLPGELPFNVTEAVRVVGEGRVQMGDGYAGWIAGDIKIAGIPALPFLVRTVEDLKKTMEILEPYVAKELEKFGNMCLFWYPYPPQNIFGRGAPVNTFDDLKGRKIRANSPEIIEMLRRLRAVPITLAPAEVPTAAQTGAIDGVTTAAFQVLSAKWYEFLTWGFLPDIHIGGPSYVLVNKKAFESLSPDIRDTLKNVAGRFQERMLVQGLTYREQMDRKTLETVQKIRFVYPSESEIQKQQKMMESYWDEWAKEKTQIEVLQKVRKILGK